MTTVLALHRVVDRRERDHDLTWDSFRRLCDLMHAQDTTDLGSPPSPGTVAVSLDDGTEDHVRAAEELHQREIAAVFFIPVAEIGTPGHMDSSQVRRLVSM